MNKLIELRQKQADIVAQMRLLLGKDSLTEEETRQYDEMEKSLEGLDKAIEREEALAKRETELSKVERPFRPSAASAAGNDGEFRSVAEFVHSVVANPRDPRLAELRAQQIGDSTLGGYMVPPQFEQSIRSVPPDGAVVRPRATVVTTGALQELSLAALDQTAAQNQFGGFTVYHTGEMTAVTEANVHLRRVTFKPRKKMGYTTISNDLIKAWSSTNSFVENQMRLAMIASDDYDFLRGDGVNKPQGVLNLACATNIARAGASAIVYADVLNMLTAFQGNTPVWLAAPSTLPQIANIRDSGSNNLWMHQFNGGVVGGIPSTLAGYPLIWCQRLPALGSKGDLILADLSMYVICDAPGIAVSVSEHFLFSTDITALKVVWHTDGGAWLSAGIVTEGDSTLTRSPFVILDVP